MQSGQLTEATSRKKSGHAASEGKEGEGSWRFRGLRDCQSIHRCQNHLHGDSSRSHSEIQQGSSPKWRRTKSDEEEDPTCTSS
ncbi:hypothetical protein VNO77_09106 [Canavalia gladiata]|uniref:Uncharacterized protein n=1 Tax=Canavalia gladiata TaxID=3824 RepID=A0AAN9MED2_CANGL